MRRLVILILLCLAGCSPFREVTAVGGYLPSVERGVTYHNTVDDIKRRYFTDTAYSAISGIPTVIGITDTAYAAGSTGLSSLASFLTLNGLGRKVVVTRGRFQNWGIGLLIHEYTHHLDDMDRDGDGEFVDHEEFGRAFRRLMSDAEYEDMARDIRRQLKPYTWFYGRFLGIGAGSEEMAFVAALMVSNKTGPDYMWHALRGILRRQ